MNQVTLKRVYGDTQTDGTLQFTYNGKTISCPTIERPWLDNKEGVSCIFPAPGIDPISYLCKWSYMASHDVWHYELQGVSGRTGIFIHRGLFVTDSMGCILLAISNCALFEAAMGKQDYSISTSLTGDSTERIDTRVMEVVYEIEDTSFPAYLGQIVDVFIEAPPLSSSFETTPAAEATAK